MLNTGPFAPRKLVSVEMKIAFITAASYRALPIKGDAAHIPVNAVVAETECGCQLFAGTIIS